MSGPVFCVACGVGMIGDIIYLYTYLIPNLKKNEHRGYEYQLLPGLVTSFFPSAGLLIFAELS